MKSNWNWWHWHQTTTRHYGKRMTCDVIEAVRIAPLTFLSASFRDLRHSFGSGDVDALQLLLLFLLSRVRSCADRVRLNLSMFGQPLEVTTGAPLLSKQIFAVIQSEEVTCNQLDHARTTTLDRTSKTVRLWRGNRLQQVKMSCAVRTNTTPASTNETREHNKYSNTDQSLLIPTNRILRTT